MEIHFSMAYLSFCLLCVYADQGIVCSLLSLSFYECGLLGVNHRIASLPVYVHCLFCGINIIGSGSESAYKNIHGKAHYLNMTMPTCLVSSISICLRCWCVCSSTSCSSAL